MTGWLRRLWDTPAVGGAPGPSRRDWILVGVLLVAVAVEGGWRHDVAWRPAAIVLGVVVVLCLPWRRVQPGRCAAVAFGSIVAVQVASILAGSGAPVGLTSSACVLLIAYAVARWGSGRATVLLVVLLASVFAVGYHRDYRTVSDAVGEAVILTFPLLLGVAVRAQTTSRARELEAVRLSEREQLARELHDTVAHHVSAMVVRAQAGRVVAAGRPEAAIEALQVIETEGARTLAEMRVLVGALRDADVASLSPAASVQDIEALATSGVDGPRVIVSISGDLQDVHPSVSAALFRIAQESVTNATRHAAGASRIDVDVRAEGDDLHLVVRDDGAVPKAESVPGYGIVGMRERATLLGGALRAAPGPAGGWVVETVLPRSGVSR